MTRSSRLLVAAFVVAACKRDASPAAVDAAAPTPKLAQVADAAAADAGPPVDRTLRPVGEVRTRSFTTHLLDDGRIVVVSHSLA